MRASLLVTSILAGSLIVSAAIAEDANPPQDPTTPHPNPIDTVPPAEQISKEPVAATDVAVVAPDARSAASSFVEHINYARVSLALKNPADATAHIAAARALIPVLKNASRQTSVETNRMTYDYETKSKYHYFPTGPVEVKQVKKGPFWAETKGLAVTDAEIVYLTLDFTGNKAEDHLNQAEESIRQNKLSDADAHLAMLIDSVVSVDEAQKLPLDKARDNIALAYNFIAMQNFDGARYSLGHADKALDAMEKDDRYKARRDTIAAMRSEVVKLEETVKKKDPTVLEATGITLKKWWTDMKDWAKD